MAGQERMTIEEVVKKVLRDEHADVIRESVKTVARELMEAEVAELIGAELGERRPDDRATQRNGYRPRRWDTRAGEIELQIPKLRQGSYFPGFLQPRKRPSKRWSQWCSRPMCAGSRPGGSISSWRASGSGSASPRSAGSPGCSTSRSKRSASARWTGLPAPPCVVPPLDRSSSDGPRPRLERAEALLRANGSAVGRVLPRASRKVREGRILEQRPKAGAVLQSNSPVDLVVSRGPGR